MLHKSAFKKPNKHNQLRDLGEFLPGLTEKTLRRMACAAGLIAIGSAVYWAYCRLRRRTDPPTELPQPDSHGKQSPLCGGRELNSTCQIIQFLSYESRHSQSESEEIRRYFVSMTKGSEIQQWWFTITETCHLNHLGFPYYTSSEDSFTGIQSVSGRMMEVLSCCRLDTFVNVPLEDCVQTFYEVTRDYWRMRAEGHEDAAHWVKTSTFNTSGSDSETLSESDSEESEESHSVEESKLPFISCHLADCDIADVALKLPALREVFSIERGFLDKIVNWDVESWEPAAKQCFMVLIDQLTAFVELLFPQPLELYGDVEGLADVVLGLLKQHVQQLLKAIKKF